MFHLLVREVHMSEPTKTYRQMCVFNGLLWTETVFKHYDDHDIGKVTFYLEIIVSMDHFGDVN